MLSRRPEGVSLADLGSTNGTRVNGELVSNTWVKSGDQIGIGPYVLVLDAEDVVARNEQGMVHAAVGYARMRNRLQTLACASSIGPGATNMVTGAALATINRLPVLLLPGDTFATRRPHPVLQGLEAPHDGNLSVNDCFKPVSRYFARVERPEQLFDAALSAMRVLTDPADTGAVTLALPEDVQTEAFDVPPQFLEPRVWTIFRRPPAPEALQRAAAMVRAARRPLIVVPRSG